MKLFVSCIAMIDKESIYARMTDAEKEVAIVLKSYGIQWSFEHPVFV
ncbi:MAG: hypothetical protein V1726_03030 [Methanobacteriota archaeon]